jgi:hypothetical protein
VQVVGEFGDKCIQGKSRIFKDIQCFLVMPAWNQEVTLSVTADETLKKESCILK